MAPALARPNMHDRPRYFRNMLWDERESVVTPSVSITESLPPLPSPPIDDPSSAVAWQTIRAHPHLFQIVTPIRADRFEKLLEGHPNRPLVRSFIRGLREGFWPMAEGDLSGTRDFPERRAKGKELGFLIEKCRKEELLGRFSKPFARSNDKLLPGMCEIPVHAVPKPDSDDHRMVVDQSAGDDSPNSLIPRDAVHWRCDNVQDLGRNILALRRVNRFPCWLFKADVSEAYRRLAMHPLWQIKQIVTVNGVRRVDRCNNFGNRGAGYLFCVFMSLVLWVAVNVWDLDGLLAYVDDNFGHDESEELVRYEPYDAWYPSKQARLLQLWDWLGIPHEKKKQVFGRAIKIIGFIVDIDRLSISLEPKSRLEHVSAIRQFLSTPSRRQPLIAWQRLLGWSSWALNVAPLLRPALQSSYAKLRGKSSRNALIFINATVRRDLSWFADTLEAWEGVHMLDARSWGPDEADLDVWTDASGVGLGFWVPGMRVGFQAHRFDVPRAKDVIFYWEALAVVSALEWACAQSPRPKRVAIYCDNTNTVNIFHTLAADDPYNDILRYSIRLRLFYAIDLRVYHVPGIKNPIADAISRFDSEKLHLLVPGATIRNFEPPRLPLGELECPN